MLNELPLQRIVIEPAAIEENFRILQGALGEGVRPVWVVKSNLYGIGLECIRQVSAPIAGYGVEDFHAAERVRRLDSSKPVLLLYPVPPDSCPSRLLPCIWNGSIVPAVENCGSVDRWIELARRAGIERFAVQIKVRSFGGRFGIVPEQLDQLADYARARGISIFGIYSHPAHSTISSDDELRAECACFVEKARKTAPEAFLHFADSACVLRGVGTDLDLVRVGMLPLGLLPVEQPAGWRKLRTAFVLYARIISVHEFRSDEGIGYSDAKRANGAMSAGIVAIGYAHGIPREISKAGYAWWRGNKIRYAAPPWMEFSSVELPPGITAPCNEEVEILGPHTPPHVFARKSGKAPEEYVVRLSASIFREVI